LDSRHQVHLWWLECSRFAPAWLEQRAEAYLSRDEQARAANFKRGRHDYLATRLLLRAVLARYIHQPAATLAFARSTSGKPRLLDSPISFNLSHSGQQAVLAVGLSPLLGVDLEQVKATRNYLGIAHQYFANNELQWLSELTAENRASGFYRLWTLKEATIKALGGTIAGSLDKLCFQLANDAITLSAAPELIPAPERWQFYQQQLDGQMLCALAADCPEPISPSWYDANEFIAQM